MSTSIPIVPTITQGGLNGAKNAHSTGFALEITHIAFGTGQYNPTGSETALAAEKKRVTIAGGGSVDPTTIQVLAEVLANTGDPFWCGEIGFYAGSTLFALHSKAAVPIAYISDTISFTASYSLGLRALPAGSVTVTIDPSGAIALSLVGAHEAAANPHPQYNQTPADIFPGGLSQQYLRKKTNTSGDWEWVDLTDGITVNVNTKEETQTLIASQVIVDLVTLTTNGIVAHIGGGRLDRTGDFVINSPTRITLNRSYPAGTKITLAQNEVAGSVINPLDSTRNLSDVQSVSSSRDNLGVTSKVDGVHTGITSVDALKVKIYSDVLSAVTASTTTTALSVPTAGAFKVAIQSNTAISFTGTVPSGVVVSFAVITINDATAGRAVSWPSVNRWTGGIIPPRTTAANARDVWTFETDDGGTTWSGNLAKADDK